MEFKLTNVVKATLSVGATAPFCGYVMAPTASGREAVPRADGKGPAAYATHSVKEASGGPLVTLIADLSRSASGSGSLHRLGVRLFAPSGSEPKLEAQQQQQQQQQQQPTAIGAAIAAAMGAFEGEMLEHLCAGAALDWGLVVWCCCILQLRSSPAHSNVLHGLQCAAASVCKWSS